MNLPDNIKETITMLRGHGDVKAIAEASGYTAVTISKALKTGYASPRVVEAIVEFYAQRRELLDQFAE